jgi:ABC-type branched-subunit amino acid transport system substrate-binding protein
MRKLALLLMVLCVAIIPVFAQDEAATLPDFIEHTACEADLTGQTITIYHLGDISASYAPITLPLLAGLTDALAYFNERGGICGAEIAQYNIDTGGDPNRTSEGYEQIHALNPDVLLLYSSSDAELLRPTLAEHQVPAILSAGSIDGLYGENANEPGWVYATNPLYADQFAQFCDYIGSEPELYPDPVIGYMGWGGPFAAFGLGGFTPEAVAHCEAAGVTVLPEPQTFLPIADATSVSTLVEAHIEAGATIVYVNALASGPVRVAEAIELIGFSEELILGSVNWGMDTSAMLLAMSSLRASDGLSVVDGMIGSMPFYWYSDVEMPGIQLLLEQAVANERDIQTMNIAYILGWTTADIYIEMYTQAANAIAAEGTTDAGEILEAIDGSVIKGIIDTIDYAPLGGLHPFTYPDGARAVQNNRIVRMELGPEITGPPNLVPLTDFESAPDTRLAMFEDAE